MWTDLMQYFRALAAHMTKSEAGQTLVEYALIIALVSIAVITALGVVTGGLNHVLNSIGGTLNGA